MEMFLEFTLAVSKTLQQGCPTGGPGAGSGPPAIFVWPPQGIASYTFLFIKFAN